MSADKQAKLDGAKYQAYREFANIKIRTDVACKTMQEIILRAQQAMIENGVAAAKRAIVPTGDADADAEAVASFKTYTDNAVNTFTIAVTKLKVASTLQSRLENADIKIEASREVAAINQIVSDMQSAFTDYQTAFAEASNIFMTNQAIGGPLSPEDLAILNTKINAVVQTSVDKINAKLPADQQYVPQPSTIQASDLVAGASASGASASGASASGAPSE